jgi:hypothetical protein
MLLVIASTKALAEIRAMESSRRRGLRAKKHPDGGVWVAAHGRDAEKVLATLAERYGTRAWCATGWRTVKPQLRLPGF